MNKRILSLLLTACMLLSLVPVFSTVSATEAQAEYDYSSLYVGADGSTNANGGKLTVLLTSFLGDSSVSADLKTWNNIAPDATKNGTLYGTWSAMGKGGIGYDCSASSSVSQLVLDASLLPVETYSLEMVASVRGTTANADGVTAEINYVNNMTAQMWLGRLQGFLFSGAFRTDGRADNAVVMIMNDTASQLNNHIYNTFGSGDFFTNAVNVYKNNTNIVNFGIDLTKSETYYNYTFLHNGAETAPTKGLTSCVIDAANTNAYDSFILFRAMGPTAYAVRLYTAPLTVAERQQNHFADVCAFYELDLSDFDASKDNSALFAYFADVTLDEGNYDTAKDAAQKKLNESAAALFYANRYVGLDGSTTENGGKLTVLLTSFLGDSSVSADLKTWNNIAPGATKHGTLYGTWSAMGKGGIGYDCSASSSVSQLILDVSLLPVESYSLEMVASVRGTTANADGKTAEINYVNNMTAQMQLGRLQGFLFSGAFRTDGRADNAVIMVMDDTASELNNHVYNTFASGDFFYNAVNVYKNNTGIVNFGIDLTKSETYYNYTFLHNGAETAPTKGLTSCVIDAANTNAYDSFILFRAMGPTAYAVRLYTAPLTVAERQQNHFADVVSFYELDLSKFDPTADNSILYAYFADVTLDADNYDSAKDAAQKKLNGFTNALFYAERYVGLDGSTTENGGKLTVLLTAFLGDSSVNGTTWTNIAPDATLNGTFTGTWTTEEKGGIGYDMASSGATHQLSLDTSLLPVDTYSLEMVASVRGFTANGDGTTVERAYKTDGNLWLGRLNGYLFSGNFDNGRGNNGFVMVMNDSASVVGKHGYTEVASGNLFYNAVDVYQNNTGIVNFGINLSKSETHYNYEFWNGSNVVAPSKNITSCEIDATNTQTKHDYFILFRNMGSTVYSVRLYTAPLTESERQQNHFGDVVSFYELDLSHFDINADNSALYAYFASVSLDATNYDAAKAEAQELVDNFLYVKTEGDARMPTASAGTTEKVVALWQDANGAQYLPAHTYTFEGATVLFPVLVAKPEVQEGASFNKVQGGLRFKGTFGIADYLAVGQAVGNAKATLHMLIVPEIYLGENGTDGVFTKEALENAGLAYVDVALTGYYEKDEVNYIFAGGLKDFSDVTKQNNPTFAAVICLDVTVDGETYTVYGDYNSACNRDALSVMDAYIADLKVGTETLAADYQQTFYTLYTSFAGHKNDNAAWLTETYPVS